jgi:hypothetical protein
MPLLVVIACFFTGASGFSSSDSLFAQHSGSFLETESGTRGYNISQKYVIPQPSQLANLPNYSLMMAACGTSQNATSCQTALNQFISDIHLMIPDTEDFVTGLQQRITTDQGIASMKQTMLDTLSQSVDTEKTNLLAASDAFATSQANYQQTIQNLTAQVSQMANPQQSPVFQLANAQKQVMLDRLTALSQAVSAFLSSQRQSMIGIVDNVFQLFRNDQAIVSGNSNQALSAATNTSQSLITQLNALRQFIQGNVTAQQSSVENQKAKLVEAQNAIEAQLANTQQSIAASITGSINAAVQDSTTSYQSKMDNLTAVIANLTKMMYSQFDSVLSNALTQDANITSTIDLNLTAAQAQVTSMTNLLSVQLKAAADSQTAASQTLATTMLSNEQQTNQSSSTLNSTLASYLGKSAETTSRIFDSSQKFMNDFASLAQSANEGANSGLTSSIASDANSMSDLNGYIGDMSGKADSQSASAANQMASSLSNTQQSMASTNVRQIIALSNSIATIDALVQFLKSKLALASDRSDMQIDSVDGLISYGIEKLQSTLSEISNKLSTDALGVSTKAKKQLDEIETQAIANRRASQNELVVAQKNLNDEIAKVTSARSDAATLANSIVLEGGRLAKELASSNDGLAAKVAQLNSSVTADWGKVGVAKANLVNAIQSALTGLSTNATSLTTKQRGDALAYILGQKTAFANTIKESSSSALRAYAASLATANATAQDLLRLLSNSSGSTNSVLSSAQTAVNQTISVLNGLPTVLQSLANAEIAKDRAIGANATRVATQNISTQKLNLIAQIRNRTSEYYRSNMPGITNLSTQLRNISARVISAQKLADSLFPATSGIFAMNDTQFQQAIANATAAVQTAGADQTNKYIQLGHNLTQVYNNLSNWISNEESRLDLVLPNVSNVVEGLVGKIQEKVTNETSNFTTFGESVFTNTTNALKASKLQQLNITKARKAEFDSAVQSAQNVTTTAFNNATALSDAEMAKQAAIANSMDSVIQAMISASGNNSNHLSQIAAQFEYLRASTANLGPSLSNSLSNGIAKVISAASAAEAATQNNLRAQNAAAVANVSSLSDQLQVALAAISAANASETNSLENVNADAVVLANAVASLGADAAQKIQQLIAQIQSGQTSLNDVLSAGKNVSLSQLTTAQDVITTITSLMTDQLTKMKMAFGTQSDKLTTYAAAVPGVLQQYDESRKKTIASIRQLVQEASSSASNYIVQSNALVNSTTVLVDRARDDVSNMKQTIPNKIAELNAEVKAEVEKIGESQDALANRIIEKAKSTRATILSQLSNFRQTKNNNQYSLSTEKVELPVVPPEVM